MATLVVLIASPLALVRAEDASVDANASASVDVNAGKPLRPLDILKMKLNGIQHAATDAKIQLRADTKVQLRTATTSGERKDIKQGAMEERKDIAKDRFGSTTQAISQFKMVVRIHGGLIKERFVLAVKQLRNLLARIDSRLTKMQSNGVDISSVVTLEADAKIATDKAEADGKAVADFIANVSDTDDRAAVKAALETKIKTAQASIKAAHEAVIKVVRALVKLAVDNKAKLKADASVSATTSVQ